MTKIIFDGQLVDEHYYFYPQRSSEEIVNNAQPIGISDGENLIYSRTGERIISVQYHVYEEKLRNVERFLTKTFVLKRQATLIFSDEPDEVWDVVINDKPTIVKNGAGISGVIEFLVPSGVAHSLKSTTVTPDTDGNITVGYQGTYPAYPIIAATMKSENGLVAFTNDKGGVLQFGSPDEVDKVVPKSQTLISDKMDLTLGKTNLASIRPLPTLMGQLSKTGSFKLSDKVFAVSSFGADTNSWAGPSWTLPFSADSFGATAQKNFSFVFRLFFVNTKPNQAGIMMYTINEADGSILASVVVKDGSLTKSVSEISFFVGEQKMQTISYSNVKTGGYAGLMSIRKSGSRFEFVYGQGVMRVFYDDTLADAEGAYATIGAGKWKGVAVPSRMEFDHYSLRADYVEATEDIPNRFSAGDVVTVDVAKRKVYLNGVIDNTLQIVGNQWDMFKLDPGINTIQPVGSSWATQFDTQLTFREAWL